MLNRFGLSTAEILLPREGTDLTKWAVVACDQYTSQPEYWRAVEDYVGDSPSTLRLIYPEIYLGEGDSRISLISEAMDDYLREGVLEPRLSGLVYLERLTRLGARRGLVVAVDLEQYDYSPGSKTPVRATEGTVIERLPPRVRIRERAALELPHVMLLIDDPGRTVIEPFAKETARLRKLYDAKLMMDGGEARGYTVEAEADIARIEAALEALFRDDGDAPLRFAVGDGNHSLAAARAFWLSLRENLPPEDRASHPARYALCEIVNLHDPALAFEPIHRVLTGVNPAAVLNALTGYARLNGATPGNAPVFAVAVWEGGRAEIRLEGAPGLSAQLLQPFLDEYLPTAPSSGIDYIHGADVAETLAARPNALAFLLPAMDKLALFPAVREGGALSRKTFSMGEAHEKRFYMEARLIR